MANKEPQLSKSERREAARAQAQKLREEQLRREKRTRAVITTSAIAGLLVVAVIVFFIFRSADSNNEAVTDFPAGTAIPASANATGGVSFGPDGIPGTDSGDDAVVVDVYFDYMCPGCGSFESINTATLDDLREKGEVTMVLHSLSILDRLSSETEFSTRSASAFAYVVENAPEQALAFHEAMFANQPEENSEGLSDEEIMTIAKGVGVPEAVANTMMDGAYTDFIAALTDIATTNPDYQTDGVFSTPLILINDEKTTNWATDGALTAAIEEAKGATVSP
jgi:protein-disulfide isomerase